MSSSENEAIEAISAALENELEGVDVDKIVDFKLKRLDREYNQTLAAEIPEQAFNEPGWQADFSDNYEACPSDDDSATEEVPINYTSDFQLSSEKVEKIKEIMAKIKINTPFWARNIPDSAFSDMLSKRIINK